MTRHYLLIASGLLIGSSLHAQRSGVPARCARVAEFVELAGGDTIGVSRVLLTDSTFESTSRAVAQGALVRYSGRLSPDGAVQLLHDEIWPRVTDSAGPPAQIADVTVRGNDLIARVAAPPQGIQYQHDRIPVGGVLYMAGAPLFLELLQRRIHIAVGATGTVPVLWLFSGGEVDTVKVARPSSDSLVLRFPTFQYALRLAPDRSILSGASQFDGGGAGSSSSLVRRDCW